jgi:hypothetical protein
MLSRERRSQSWKKEIRLGKGLLKIISRQTCTNYCSLCGGFRTIAVVTWGTKVETLVFVMEVDHP